MVDQYVDLTLLALLLGIGKIIKSSVLFEKIPNKWIPLIIPVLGIILEVIFSGCQITMITITKGIYSGLAATGVHQVGKNIFANDDQQEELLKNNIDENGDNL